MRLGRQERPDFTDYDYGRKLPDRLTVPEVAALIYAPPVALEAIAADPATTTAMRIHIGTVLTVNGILTQQAERDGGGYRVFDYSSSDYLRAGQTILSGLGEQDQV